MEPSDALRTLRTFRYSLYECLHRRADALFELTDAILTADSIPSPAHLSLQAPQNSSSLKRKLSQFPRIRMPEASFREGPFSAARE